MSADQRYNPPIAQEMPKSEFSLSSPDRIDHDAVAYNNSINPQKRTVTGDYGTYSEAIPTFLVDPGSLQADDLYYQPENDDQDGINPHISTERDI